MYTTNLMTASYRQRNAMHLLDSKRGLFVVARYYRSRDMRAKPDQGQNPPLVAIDALFLHPPARRVKVP